jgi:hypothetical protein
MCICTPFACSYDAEDCLAGLDDGTSDEEGDSADEEEDDEGLKEIA